MSHIAIRVDGLGKRYRIGKRERYRTLRDTVTDAVHSPFRRIGSLLRGTAAANVDRSNDVFWALQDVSFDVPHGSVVGIIGRNGAGKSTLLKILSRITEPTRGRVEIQGRVGSLLEVGTGFHPELSGRENIFLNGAILGMKRAEIARKFDEIVAFAEVDKFIDTPVKRFSSGMYMRLAFAVAAHLEPDILVIDEVLAVGDVGFQRKCLGKMGEVAKQGRTVVFVSHNFIAVENLCTSAVLLKHGRVVTIGDTRHVLAKYLGDEEVEPRNLASVATRVGSGEIRFESCSVFPIGDEQGAVIRSGESFTVRLHFRCAVPVDRPSFSVALRSVVGAPIFTVHTADVGAEIPRVEGEGVIDLNVFKPNLMPGTYSLDMAVGDQLDPHRYDMLLGVVRLQVEAADVYGSGKLSGANWSFVYFDCQWRLGAVATHGRPAQQNA